MPNGTGRGDAWVQLAREVLGSWRLLLGAVVLILTCTPVAVVVVVMLFAAR